MGLFVAFCALAACIGCTSSSSVPAPTPGITPAATLPSQIDALAQAYLAAGYSPGLVVGAASNGRILYAKGYGFRDLAAGLPVLTSTTFAIGSVTKHITAASILWLQENPASVVATYRPLSLEDLLSKYIPTSTYKYAAQMSLRQLIYMVSGIAGENEQTSSGIDPYDQIFASAGLVPTTPGAVMSGLNSTGLFSTPGSTFDYSNPGYYLLGLVIQIASGASSYEDFVTQHIFNPLGMSSSHFSLAPDPAKALAYLRTGFTNPWTRCNDFATDAIDPAGGIVTTVGDLLLWDSALRSGSFISAQSFALMFSMYRLNNGTIATDLGQPFGMGLIILGSGYGVEGDTITYQSANFSALDGVDVAVMANSGDEYLGDQLEALAARIHNLFDPSVAFPVSTNTPNPAQTLPALICTGVSGIGRAL